MFDTTQGTLAGNTEKRLNQLLKPGETSQGHFPLCVGYDTDVTFTQLNATLSYFAKKNKKLKIYLLPRKKESLLDWKEQYSQWCKLYPNSALALYGEESFIEELDIKRSASWAAANDKLYQFLNDERNQATRDEFEWLLYRDCWEFISLHKKHLEELKDTVIYRKEVDFLFEIIKLAINHILDDVALYLSFLEDNGRNFIIYPKNFPKGIEMMLKEQQVKKLGYKFEKKVHPRVDFRARDQVECLTKLTSPASHSTQSVPHPNQTFSMVDLYPGLNTYHLEHLYAFINAHIQNESGKTKEIDALIFTFYNRYTRNKKPATGLTVKSVSLEQALGHPEVNDIFTLKTENGDAHFLFSCEESISVNYKTTLSARFTSKIKQLLAINKTLKKELTEISPDRYQPQDVQRVQRIEDNETPSKLSFWHVHGLTSTSVRVVSRALKSNLSVKEFRVSSSGIGDEGAISVARSLQSNESMESVALFGNNIQSTGALFIAKALRLNTVLTLLDLYHNEIGDDGAIAIANALKENHTVTRLSLRANKIGDKGATEIAHMLKDNRRIVKLDIRTNMITSIGAADLAEALKVNSTLKVLYLGLNNLGDQGAKLIAKALHENKTIKKIKLSSNKINPSGAKKLASALLVNKSIENLDINGNTIGDEGAIAIAVMLELNTTLLALNLMFNGIGDAGATRLAEAITLNNTLERLNLKFNSKIGVTGADALVNAMEVNRSIIDICILSQEFINRINLYLMRNNTRHKLGSLEEFPATLSEMAHKAVINNDVKTLKEFIHQYKDNKLVIASINAPIYEGGTLYGNKTLLMIAVECGFVDIVRTLIEVEGVKVNEQLHQYTPLKYACWAGNPEMVKALLASPEIDVNATDKNGEGALWTASILGQLEVVCLLINDTRMLNLKDVYNRLIAIEGCRSQKVNEIESLLRTKINEHSLQGSSEVSKSATSSYVGNSTLFSATSNHPVRKSSQPCTHHSYSQRDLPRH